MTIPERIRDAARLACEPARSELRKIADEVERERKQLSNDHWRSSADNSRSAGKT